jgi:hypothetical protein
MSNGPIFTSSARRDPVPRILSAAALGVSVLALIFSMGGLAPAKPTQNQGTKQAAAEKRAAGKKRATTAKQAAAKQKAAAKKRAAASKRATANLNKRINGLKAQCPVSNAIDLGTWCLESTTYRVPAQDAGKTNYLYASQKCVEEGGWLPSAAQLIGAAPFASLKSTIDDDPASSAVSEFPEPANGIKDEREMTGDLFTIGAGSRSAGSEGVTVGSKGTGNLSEPNPVPIPAEPFPETLDYVTVYDNHNIGGFAGGEPVTKAENFRCAYAKGFQGKPKNVSSRS